MCEPTLGGEQHGRGARSGADVMVAGAQVAAVSAHPPDMMAHEVMEVDEASVFVTGAAETEAGYEGEAEGEAASAAEETEVPAGAAATMGAAKDPVTEPAPAPVPATARDAEPGQNSPRRRIKPTSRSRLCLLDSEGFAMQWYAGNRALDAKIRAPQGRRVTRLKSKTATAATTAAPPPPQQPSAAAAGGDTADGLNLSAVYTTILGGSRNREVPRPAWARLADEEKVAVKGAPGAEAEVAAGGKEAAASESAETESAGETGAAATDETFAEAEAAEAAAVAAAVTDAANTRTEAPAAHPPDVARAVNEAPAPALTAAAPAAAGEPAREAPRTNIGFVQCKHCGKRIAAGNAGWLIAHEKRCDGRPHDPEAEKDRKRDKLRRKRDPTLPPPTSRARLGLLDSEGFAMQWYSDNRALDARIRAPQMNSVTTRAEARVVTGSAADASPSPQQPRAGGGSTSSDGGDAATADGIPLSTVYSRILGGRPDEVPVPSWVRAGVELSRRSILGRNDATGIDVPVGPDHQADVGTFDPAGAERAGAPERAEDARATSAEVEAEITEGLLARFVAAAYGDERARRYVPEASDLDASADAALKRAAWVQRGADGAPFAADGADVPLDGLTCPKCRRVFGNQGARTVHEKYCGKGGRERDRRRRKPGPAERAAQRAAMAARAPVAKRPRPSRPDQASRPTHAALSSHAAPSSAGAESPDVVEDVYAVERLLGRRTVRGGGVQYLVQWLGYGPGFHSWEAAENILDGVLVTEFEMRTGLLKNASHHPAKNRPLGVPVGDPLTLDDGCSSSPSPSPSPGSCSNSVGIAPLALAPLALAEPASSAEGPGEVSVTTAIVAARADDDDYGDAVEQLEVVAYLPGAAVA